MERLLTIDDAAYLLQMTPQFVEQLIRMDYLECIRVGNEARIEPDALRTYLDNQKAVTPLIGQQRLRAAD